MTETGDSASDRREDIPWVEYQLPLRRDGSIVTVRLPGDVLLTVRDVDRIHRWLSSMVFTEEEDG
jgi:hypothetical protein